MERRSGASSVNSRRTNSHATKETLRRNMSYQKRAQNVSDQDVYLYVLKAAYLAYLLLPRQKRVQHVANISKPIQRSSTSINDMVKDFSLIRDSKSTRFPHGFMAALDKRLAGVLTGTEKMPEYQNSDIKRTFGVFLNEFKNPTFRKSMEKDRRVEDLLLIFFSKATATLSLGKTPDDDSWKLMVDRHVALFVRLISSTLNHNDWTRDRPELTSRLKTLETKLLQHDQDLADSSQRNGGQGGTSVEVEVPRSYDVKDMPLVIRVCRIFAKPTVQAQNDINAHKEEWTEKEALKDVKEYQTHLSLHSSITLSKNDFDADEAYETWRKGETSDLSQMVQALLLSDPSLLKSSSGSLPQFKAPTAAQSDSGYSELAKSISRPSGEYDSSYVIDQPVDMSALNLGDSSPRDAGSIDASQANFTFIPPNSRIYYRQLLKTALSHDLADDDLQPSAIDGGGEMKLFSTQSTELLNEIALRWRIPQFSRLVLFLDVVREKFQNQEMSLETVDAAFNYTKAPPVESKKGKSHSVQVTLYDRSKWTVADYALMQSLLAGLHDALLREFFEAFQHCFESKPPNIVVIMAVMEEHIWSDPSFSGNEEDLTAFGQMMSERLRESAREKYHDMLATNVPDNSNQWEFYNVIKLGQSVTSMCHKIQKRYKKQPEIMGVRPLPIFVEEILPSFSSDAKELVARIMELTRKRDEEVPVQDGFELYKELVDIRKVYTAALPGREFEFQIEDLLQEFVWRWISTADSILIDWIDRAVTLDEFQVVQDASASDQLTDDKRHSQSAVDIYRSFNQSIDQIIKLDWDNDLQYAKFMTAISKSIGKGVSRYCELLETKFAHEMDRQTPEQEARAQQTQREKWLTAARDAWATGTLSQKIEPFNFWPESFVKINDIEYATLQLDRVEQEMNVDQCVAAINKYEPPPPPNMRKRGESKFMFTVKIIEAEDLKAGDMNGSSDPYVVLGDEYQKRLAKTRIVYQSLNPRWDETVDIITTGLLNVIVTMWDWDALGDHDCLGRTSIKLDPNHFDDYLPREFWLDLDTQGRVLVRVTMEGERDDIQFHFGKAFRTLKRTERDMTRKVTDKLSAYISQCLSRRTLRALTSTYSASSLAGASMTTMRGYFSKVSGRPMSVISPPPAAPNTSNIAESASNALKPLLQYFDDNFAIMKETLTDSAMIMVMTRLWKEVLVTIEGLLVPPLSDKPSTQKPLTQAEVDVVYKWLQTLFEFFLAFNHETGVTEGVPMDVLKSPKYHDLQNLNFFYFESGENLVRTSEAMASATAVRQQEQVARLNRLSAPAGGFLSPSLGGTRRSKSILQSRNLGTMKKAKAEKRKEAQADPNDDMILRILRMRPEGEKYIKDRSRQKERLAATAAADAIVQQSLQAGRGGHSHSQSVGNVQRTGAIQRGGIRQWGTIRE